VPCYDYREPEEEQAGVATHARVPVERMEFARIPELGGTEVLRGDGVTRLFRVYHESFAISSIYSSSGEWVYRNRTWTLAPGQLSMMEPGEVHYNLRHQGFGRFRVLFVSSGRMARASEELEAARLAPRLKHPQMSDPSVFRRFARLHEALERRDATALEREVRYAQAVRCYLERCVESPVSDRHPGASSAVDRAKEYIQDHFPMNLTLEELSRAAGLSRYHLIRVFQARTGLTPHEFLMQVRVDRARERLARGDSIAHIAADTGFTDQSHLGRQFKRSWGMTPGQYQRSIAPTISCVRGRP
jgi:AraC-like DNA-binding protein